MRDTELGKVYGEWEIALLVLLAAGNSGGRKGNEVGRTAWRASMVRRALKNRAELTKLL